MAAPTARNTCSASASACACACAQRQRHRRGGGARGGFGSPHMVRREVSLSRDSSHSVGTHACQGGESNPGGNSIRPAEWWKLSDDYATALVLCDELRSKHREASYLVRTLRTSVDGCASDMVDGLGGDERDKRRRSQEAERLREHTKAVSHAAAIAYSDFSDPRGESPLPAVAAAACVVEEARRRSDSANDEPPTVSALLAIVSEEAAALRDAEEALARARACGRMFDAVAKAALVQD